ncbi:uncharacterized protein LOC121250728 [Juglans microcarpa x Juglans regia]|uniref:uncharacterized protein LOC121250728 n=1 Tax=Juglans microcarpa x Juglans regia TaxID=2249226 RepID=UPI001B7F1D85|nr:uncharacterized protein LOC121250728 [Juglans microcarpa x Juglans regia]
MLSRSFKAAKCKTALKLAVSRIKLLKNKREAQVKQLKRAVAKLLQSGQDRTARIRVEHVVREDKTTSAYELIEIYCELIVARLSIIDSQKNCPIDMKEAISSVIFASPRCGDIPELMDVRKHFTAKYGKEFVSAAIELRPECGVSRMLVEKLSAKTPDGQTKIKILRGIAEEHNVKWDPNSLEEQDTRHPEDLLNGPNTFEKASKIFLEPRVQASPSRDDKGPPNVHVPPKHDASGNFYEQHARYSPTSQNVNSADGGAKRVTTFGTFHSDVGTPGNESEERESTHSYSGYGNAFSLGGKNWNMEFKDATAAAQAAAASAELASMAARAAAELSSREKVTRQYSMESPKSSACALSGRESQKYARSQLRGEHLTKHPVNNAFPGRNSWMHEDQIDRTEQDILAGETENFYRNNHKNTDKSTRSASLKSTTASIDNGPLVSGSQKTDRYPQRNSSDLKNSDSIGGESTKRRSNNNEAKFVSKMNDNMEYENIDYSGDAGIRRQSSRVSSHSHSSTFIDDQNDILNLNRQNLGHDAGREPFAIDQGSIHSDHEETSYDKDSIVFDEYCSDTDDYKFNVDKVFKGQESSLHFSSPGRESSENLLGKRNALSARKNIDELFGKSHSPSHSFGKQHSSLLFSESSVAPAQPHDLSHMTCDYSDGESSGGGEDLEKSKFVGSKKGGMYPREQNVYSSNSELYKIASQGLKVSSTQRENLAYKRKPRLPPSSIDSDHMEVGLETNQGKEFCGIYDRKFGYSDLPSPKLEKSGSDLRTKDKEHVPGLPDTWKDDELLKGSSSDSGSGLNLGKLTGGLRNKGFRHPPYTTNTSGNASSFTKLSGNTSSMIDQSSPSVTVRTSISPNVHNREPRNQNVALKHSKEPSSRALVSSSDSDEDSEHALKQNISSNQEPYNQKVGREVNKHSSSRVSTRYFNADTSDSEGDHPKQDFTCNARTITGFSQRTKAAASSTSRSSYSKATDSSAVSLTPDHAAGRKSSSRISYATEDLPKSLSQTKSSGHLGNSEQRPPAVQATSKPMLEFERSRMGTV